MKSNLNQYSVYIKLPVYVGEFLRYVFRATAEEGIVLPQGTEFNACFCNFLVENKDLEHRDKQRLGGRERDKLSYSHAAYTIGSMKNRPRNTYRMKVPKKRELEKLFAFRLPSQIWRHNGLVDTNEYYELSLRGGRHFRTICTDYFWTALRTFIVGNEKECLKLHKDFNRSLTIERFLSFHGVNTLYHDTIVRTYQRKFKNVPDYVC